IAGWRITKASVSDHTGDVSDADGPPRGSCPGMDLLGASSSRTNVLLTVTLTLNSAPSATKAILCATAGATGGLWGAEFWAASSEGGTDGGNTFYVAYRDNPLDGSPRVEAGVVD